MTDPPHIQKGISAAGRLSSQAATTTLLDLTTSRSITTGFSITKSIRRDRLSTTKIYQIPCAWHCRTTVSRHM